MKTIELVGTVKSKSEHQNYNGENVVAAAIGFGDRYSGDELQVRVTGPSLTGLQVGSAVRILVLDETPKAEPTQKKDMIGEVAKLISALEAGQAEGLRKATETEGWSDKKIERRTQPQETICSSGGIYAPGTK